MRRQRMAVTMDFPMTYQGVRDLDNPRRTSGRVNVGPDERAASTVLGGLLAGFGLGYCGVPGVLLAAVGAGLAFRGVSGHCYGYEAAGINTAR
jgi:uncharacterized membrane protein